MKKMQLPKNDYVRRVFYLNVSIGVPLVDN